MFLDPHFRRAKPPLTALACRSGWPRRAADALALLRSHGFRLVRRGEFGGIGDRIDQAGAVCRRS